MAATASRAAKRPKSANAAALLALAVSSLGPPSPFLRASDGELTAARGSYCWVAGRHGQCVDTLAPVTKGSLLVTPGDRIRVDMRGRADSLGAWLRGGRDPRRLRVHRLDSAHFTIRVPAGMRRPRVLDLLARYPRGDGAFGARLRIR